MTTVKKRNATATRQRILEAAQQVFHEEGFDGATTREIANRADVNMALIARYFGSKIGLFEKAILPYLDLGWVVDGGIEKVPERLVDNYLNSAPYVSFDPMVVFLRSVSSVEAGPILQDALRKQIVAPLVDALEGSEAEARAILLASQIGGLIVYFRILGQKTRDAEQAAVMRRHLITYFERLINEETAP